MDFKVIQDKYGLFLVVGFIILVLVIAINPTGFLTRGAAQLTKPIVTKTPVTNAVGETTREITLTAYPNYKETIVEFDKEYVVTEVRVTLNRKAGYGCRPWAKYNFFRIGNDEIKSYIGSSGEVSEEVTKIFPGYDQKIRQFAVFFAEESGDLGLTCPLIEWIKVTLVYKIPEPTLKPVGVVSKSNTATKSKSITLEFDKEYVVSEINISARRGGGFGCMPWARFKFYSFDSIGNKNYLGTSGQIASQAFGSTTYAVPNIKVKKIYGIWLDSGGGPRYECPWLDELSASLGYQGTQDTKAPVITVTYSPTSPLANQPVMFAITVTDDVQIVDPLKVSIDGVQKTPSCTRGTTTRTCSLSASFAIAGSHSISATASDGINSISKTQTFNVYVSGGGGGGGGCIKPPCEVMQ